MSRFVVVANQKGGVGKTTTVINLGTALALAEKRVLIVDMDPQGNATSGLGFDGSSKKSVYNPLMGLGTLEENIVETATPFLFLSPSSDEMQGFEVEVYENKERAFLLKRALQKVRDRFDYVFIDTPPSLGFVTVNALVAADLLLVPLQAEYYALEGLSQLMRTVQEVQRVYNPSLELQGIVITMADERTNLSRQVEEEARKFFGAKVYETKIARNVKLSEAPSFGQSIIHYDVRSKGAQAYLHLAKEMLERE
ncbi:MAG: Chromosome partitioning protein ParA [Candidatus Aminicenantes bacterium ADurb.Bin508]|jgi:chromosome partitioning protein|nr:MAG: Chromosome partitioning protein ParA [Candidatus Aminicenantes bacterium ADurb.Bin508]HNX41527.1 ParA family protein [Candidatus Aminicenantes bacterium]HPS99785.1 ParA family protein [Candidatus Aminicenantes bacterium]